MFVGNYYPFNSYYVFELECFTFPWILRKLMREGD